MAVGPTFRGRMPFLLLKHHHQSIQERQQVLLVGDSMQSW